MKDKQSAEIACLAVHTDYQKLNRGNRLLEHLQMKAKKLNMHTLFVLSTQAMHWFIERGFEETNLESLPEQRKQFYNYERNSKVLCKHI
jgi:amino-acid N-acetyltransferase